MSASNRPSSSGYLFCATRDLSDSALILHAQVQGVLRRHPEKLRLALLFGSQAHGTTRTDGAMWISRSPPVSRCRAEFWPMACAYWAPAHNRWLGSLGT